MEVRGQLHALAALPPGKISRYPLDRRMVEPQSPSGLCGVEKILLSLPGIEPQPPALNSLLYRISYLGSILVK
jgi:hypothetical protein